MEYSARQRRHPRQRRLSPDLDLKLTERCLVLMQKAASPLASASNLADGRRGQWLAKAESPGGLPKSPHVLRPDICRSRSHFARDDAYKTSVMTATLFALHALQSGNVQDFDGSRGDPANEALAFQSRECAFGGLRHGSQIIGEIEAVHR